MTCSSLFPVLEASFEAVVLADTAGNIIYSNGAAQDLFEWGTEGGGGNTVKDVSSVFRFPIGEGSANGGIGRQPERSWKDIVGILGTDYVRWKGVGFKGNGTDFPVTVNLTKLGGCDCCRHQRARNHSYICAYIRDRRVQQEVRALKKEVTLLKNTQKALILASQDSTIIVDEDGIIQSVDEVTLQQFDYAKEELVGRNISVLMNDDHAGRHDAYMQAYMTSGVKLVIGKRRELKAKRKDGSVFPIQLGVSEIERTDPREKRLFAGMLVNLSQRDKAYEMLEQSKRIRRGMLESAFDPMFSIGETGTILMVNRAASEQFGWTEEEFVGSNISMICGGGHAERHDDYLRRYLLTGEKRVMGKKRELIARRRNGTEFPIELGLADIESEPGSERLFCGFVRDLTRHKSDELELRRKQSLTAGVIEASFDAMFSINHRGIIQMVNGTAVEKFGWSREEFIGQNISMIAGGGRAPNHDNYIKRYLRTGEKRVMGKKRELRARRKDGSEFPIELGLTEVQGVGEERFFCGFIRDLSKSKADELELRRKQRLTLGIIEASFDAVFTINENGVIKMVNRAAKQQFGWSRDEFIGSNVSMICGGGHAKRHDEYLRRYLKTGEKRVMGMRRELPARRKDGSEFLMELGLSEIKTDYGEERMFCGFIRYLAEVKPA